MVISKGQVKVKSQKVNFQRCHAAHVFRLSLKKEFTSNGLKSVSKMFKRQTEWVRSRSGHKRSSVKHEFIQLCDACLQVHSSKRNSLVRVLNVYLRQVKVEEHRSGQGQVIKGQLSYSYEYSCDICFYVVFEKKKKNALQLVSALHFTVFRANCISQSRSGHKWSIFRSTTNILSVV